MTTQHPNAPQYRKYLGHEKGRNELLQAALQGTAPAAAERMQRRKDRPVYLFDVPRIIRNCMDALRFHGVGAPQVVLIAFTDRRAEVTVRYFHALDSIADAEKTGTRNDHLGNYESFELPVAGEMAVIRWNRPVEVGA